MAFDDLHDNLQHVRERIADACARAGRSEDHVQILAVTKGHSVEAIDAAVREGLIDVGENRVQELLEKLPTVENTARVHLIGRLQSNKVNKVVGRVETIMSVGRRSLLEKIGRRAVETSTVQKVLLQVNISDEEQKGGCEPEATGELWSLARETAGIDPLGLMGMARYDADERELRRSFSTLRELSLDLSPDRRVELSMGMSGDYEIAVEEGATLLRLGSVLFGPRG